MIRLHQLILPPPPNKLPAPHLFFIVSLLWGPPCVGPSVSEQSRNAVVGWTLEWDSQSTLQLQWSVSVQWTTALRKRGVVHAR